MSSLRAGLLLALLALANSCAISQLMPPYSVTQPYATTSTSLTRAPLPARRVFRHHKHIIREYDASTDQTRVSLTTHRGTYFLWIHHPRLTFFYVLPGAAAGPAPANVFLIFRMLDPQAPASNHLALLCDGVREELAVTPVFWLEPGAITASRHYMYELPLPNLAAFVACTRAAIAVGDVNASFSQDQLEALRDLMSGLRAE